jgi:hypothetical protein
MSRFFPHPAYAEDQPFPKGILTLHVLTRGFQVGALGGALVSIPTYFLRKPSSPLYQPRFYPFQLLRSSGVGAAVGTGILSLALIGRMWGREPIEWADRSWRLLENRGQVETDNWAYPGAVLGAVGTYFSGNVARLGWKGLLGGTGLGSLVGMGGYTIWKTAGKGRKLDEDRALKP